MAAEVDIPTVGRDPFWVFPARDGAIASRRRDALMHWQQAVPAAPDDRVLPGGSDHHIRQPPLPLPLDPAELDELCDTGRQAAATVFGPERQDKDSNQDFALAARLAGADGTSYALAIVADGVSTKTLWAERASRLACIAAYKFVRRWLARHAMPFAEEALSREGAFRVGLVEEMREAFVADRRLLNALRHVSPAWSPAIYGSVMDDDRLWYNTTLVLACLGGARGVYVSIGDGGAVLFRDIDGRRESTVLLRSDDTLTIEHAVTIGMSANHFSMRPINLETAQAATIVLTSDGVDRTVQKSRGVIGYDRLVDAPSPAMLARFLDDLTRGDAEAVEQDNMSVAVATAVARSDVHPALSQAALPEAASPAQAADLLLTLLPASTDSAQWETAQARRGPRGADVAAETPPEEAPVVSVASASNDEASNAERAGPTPEAMEPPASTSRNEFDPGPLATEQDIVPPPDESGVRDVPSQAAARLNDVASRAQAIRPLAKRRHPPTFSEPIEDMKLTRDLLELRSCVFRALNNLEGTGRLPSDRAFTPDVARQTFTTVSPDLAQSRKLTERLSNEQVAERPDEWGRRCAEIGTMLDEVEQMLRQAAGL